MKRIHLGFLFIGIMLILGAAEVSACICMPPSDHPLTREEKFNRYRSKAVTVFSGRVVSDKILFRRIKGTTSQFLSTRLNIIVDRFWGAPVPGEVFLIENMTSCDARLFAGESYLVFVYQLAGSKIMTGACSGNIELKYAAEELRLLGEGSRPQPRKLRKPVIDRRSKK